MHIQTTLAKDTHNEFPHNTLFSESCPENPGPSEAWDYLAFSFLVVGEDCPAAPAPYTVAEKQPQEEGRTVADLPGMFFSCQRPGLMLPDIKS